MNDRYEQTFRILRATAHKPGHPEYREWEEWDSRKQQFVIRREGCCERVTGVVFIGVTMPEMLRRKGRAHDTLRLNNSDQPKLRGVHTDSFDEEDPMPNSRRTIRNFQRWRRYQNSGRFASPGRREAS